MRRVLALALVLSCTEQNRIIVHTSALDDQTKPDVGRDVDFVHVPTTGYAAQKPGFYPVHDSSDWLFVWKDPRPDAKPPPAPQGIDFNKEMLFVATAGDVGAQRIDITKIVDTSSGLQVYVTETLGGADCPVPANAVPPMDIAVFASTTEDIHVHHDRIHAEECGAPPEAIALCRLSGAGLPGKNHIVATPGQIIDCDASQSKARSGSITDRSWQLSQLPVGSTTKLTVGSQGLGLTFLVDAWGTYLLSLEVHDAARNASAVATIDAPPPELGIPIELHWTGVDRNYDASKYPHLELHVSDAANPGDECGPATAKTWCEVHVVGTVQQAILRPERGKTYRTYVSYQDDRPKEAPVACVRLFPRGRPSVATCDELVRAANTTWEVGGLDVETMSFYDLKKGKPKPIVTGAPVDGGVPDGGHGDAGRATITASPAKK